VDTVDNNHLVVDNLAVVDIPSVAGMKAGVDIPEVEDNLREDIRMGDSLQPADSLAVQIHMVQDIQPVDN